MYKHLYIPVDNSEHSNRAVELGLHLAKAWGAKITGSHIYAAKMHDIRFKQMEFTLPEKYQEEGELLRQRKTHDSLITMGLQLISDSYLDVLETKCQKAGIEFLRHAADGKNWKCILADIEAGDCDLVILGALGIGAVRHSGLGSVCERVVRRCRKDILVVKDTRPLSEQLGPIVVGIDGSPQSYAGLNAAFSVASTTQREVQGVAVYDPYLHYAIFNGIVGVLSERASKTFRFKDQERLHEDIIDTGLAKIYQSHLDVAQRIAEERGAPLKTCLKDGKAFEKVHALVEESKASLLVTGKVGIHNAELDIGSNAENLLRLAPCNVLLVSQQHVPPIDVKAEASMLWTEEATARLTRVPAPVRDIARTAVHRHAMERGHSIISSDILDEVMALFMPKTSEKMRQLAEEVARDRLDAFRADGVGPVFVCSSCGKIARGVKPVVCAVCDAPGDRFGLQTRKALEALIEEEGEVTESETFDGVKVQWTLEAREVVRAVKDGYIRRRAEAQLEKTARVRRLTAIDAALVSEVLSPDGKSAPAERRSKAVTEPPTREFAWTDDATARLNRVPAGFMRDNCRLKIEEYALEKGSPGITLDIAEGGLAKARELMARMISAHNAGEAP